MDGIKLSKTRIIINILLCFLPIVLFGETDIARSEILSSFSSYFTWFANIERAGKIAEMFEISSYVKFQMSWALTILIINICIDIYGHTIIYLSSLGYTRAIKENFNEHISTHGTNLSTIGYSISLIIFTLVIFDYNFIGILFQINLNSSSLFLASFSSKFGTVVYSIAVIHGLSALTAYSICESLARIRLFLIKKKL